MKRRLIAVLLCISLCLPTVGMATELLPLYEDAYRLVFQTGDVTLQVQASLMLDEEPFKTVSFTHIQKGIDYYRTIYEHSLLETGSWMDHGYVILTTGDKLHYVSSQEMELVTHTHWDEQESILRCTAAMTPIHSMLTWALPTLEQGLPAGAITVNGQELTIHIDGSMLPQEGVSGLLMSILTLYGYTTRWVDRTRWDTVAWSDIRDYGTITEGILYSTRGCTIDQLDMIVTRDAEGRVASIQGNAVLILETIPGVTHRLAIEGSATMTDYGASTLPDMSVLTESIWLGRE